MIEEMERDDASSSWAKRSGTTRARTRSREGMLERFGERRVIDTPIAETRLRRRRHRRGDGRAAADHRVHDLELLARRRIDQIVNNAAKLRQMSGGQFTLPIVFRGPGGAAHELGAQHSQALESLYAHVPGLKVVVPSTPADAKGLLKAAIRDDNPVVFIESETLYALKGEVPDGRARGPARRRPTSSAPGSDVTLVAWGKMVHACARGGRGAREGGHRGARWSTCARSARSTTRRSLASVRKTHRCVVVEEGWPFGGVAAEVDRARRARRFDELDAPLERVTTLDVPMPYAANLEALVLPSPERIAATVRRRSAVRAPGADGGSGA